MNMPTATVTVLLGLALCVTGCEKKLEQASVQNSITDAYKKVDLPLKTVTCPADKPMKKGVSFDCDAVTNDGEKTTIKVTQKDDEGNLGFKPVPLLVNQKVIGNHMAPKLGAGTVVKCPDKVMVAKKDDTFTCEATMNNAAAKVVFIAKDAEGKYGATATPEAAAAAAPGAEPPKENVAEETEEPPAE